MMNVGAVSSLCGFMMTDVLHLRSLSIFGSLCGMAYNSTRSPPQWNGVAWGLVFASTNAFMIMKLLAEQSEVKFSEEEWALYRAHFEDQDISPLQFFRLMRMATWERYSEGDVVVAGGVPLDRVVFVHAGRFDAYSMGTDDPPPQQAAHRRHASTNLLYTYSASETRAAGGGEYGGTVIGGTALVDPSVLGRKYPNEVVAVEPSVCVSWRVDDIREAMKHDRAVEGALVRTLYVEIAEEELLRWRKWRRSQASAAQEVEHKKPQPPARRATAHAAHQQMMDALHEYHGLLAGVVADGVVNPVEKRRCREFRAEHGVSSYQHTVALQRVGWTPAEWEDGIHRSVDGKQQASKQ